MSKADSRFLQTVGASLIALSLLSAGLPWVLERLLAPKCCCGEVEPGCCAGG